VPTRKDVFEPAQEAPEPATQELHPDRQAMLDAPAETIPPRRAPQSDPPGEQSEHRRG